MLALLGPLGFRPSELWILTWGEAKDLLEAWRYREYLDSQKRAQMACWLLNGSGNLKHSINIADLVGYWVDGQVMGKEEYREFLEEKVRRKKVEKGGR